jgi:hypothetical protein
MVPSMSGGRSCDSINPPTVSSASCVAVGSPDRAREHFEVAFAFCRRAGYGANTHGPPPATLLIHTRGANREAEASVRIDALAITREPWIRPLLANAHRRTA